MLTIPHLRTTVFVPYCCAANDPKLLTGQRPCYLAPASPSCTALAGRLNASPDRIELPADAFLAARRFRQQGPAWRLHRTAALRSSPCHDRDPRYIGQCQVQTRALVMRPGIAWARHDEAAAGAGLGCVRQ